MSKYKITTLTPIHIGSGDEYESNFNLLYKDGFIYIYDEFKLVEFFISRNIEIPPEIESLKENILKFKDEIISSNLHKRKILSNFNKIEKTLLEQVSTQNQVIITGSSIKGAIRTAYLYKMFKNGTIKKEFDYLQEIENDLLKESDFNRKKELEKQKKRILGEIDKIFTFKTKTIFRNIKISDSLSPLSSQVFKSINIKKEKTHQSNRSEKVNKIANFVESIKEKESSEIIINILDTDEKYFDDLEIFCNDFYKSKFEEESRNYFLNKQEFPEITLKPKQFLLNIGRFSGVDLKSVYEIRSLLRTGSDNDKETSARTYALEKDIEDNVYFESSLLPFGWLLCELID